MHFHQSPCQSHSTLTLGVASIHAELPFWLIQVISWNTYHCFRLVFWLQIFISINSIFLKMHILLICRRCKFPGMHTCYSRNTYFLLLPWFFYILKVEIKWLNSTSDGLRQKFIQILFKIYSWKNQESMSLFSLVSTWMKIIHKGWLVFLPSISFRQIRATFWKLQRKNKYWSKEYFQTFPLLVD